MHSAFAVVATALPSALTEPLVASMSYPAKHEVPPTISMPTISMAEALASGRVTFTNSWVQDAIFYVGNTHVLLSICFAHPAHPYSRCRRLLVLINSLSFAFFITAVLHALIPVAFAQSLLQATVGTILQLLFDLPVMLVGSCACANNACLPAPVRAVCQCASMVVLYLHCCQGILYAVLGAMLLVIIPSAHVADVWIELQTTKMAAFLWAIPTGLLLYALLRRCERSQPLPFVGRDMV